MEPLEFCKDPKRPYCPGCRKDYSKHTGPGAKHLHEAKCKHKHPGIWDVEPSPPNPEQGSESDSEQTPKPDPEPQTPETEPKKIGEAVREDGTKADVYNCPYECGTAVYEGQEFCHTCGKHLNWSE